MKRSIIIEIIAITEIVAYLAIIFLWLLTKNLMFPLWFSLGCALIGIWCLVKSYYFNLDSSFWLGSVLIMTGITGFLIHFNIIATELVVPAYLLCFALASAFCGVKFHKKYIHYKISFFFTLEDLWILLYSNNIISLVVTITLCVATLSLFLGGKYVFKRGKRI